MHDGEATPPGPSEPQVTPPPSGSQGPMVPPVPPSGYQPWPSGHGAVPPSGPPPGYQPWPGGYGAVPPPPGSSGRNVAVIVGLALVVGVVLLAAVGLVAVMFLGRTPSTTTPRFTMRHIPMPGDSDYTGTTTPDLDGSALSDVGTLMERLCSTVGTDGHSFEPVEDFHPLREGDDRQYAQVVRPRYRRETLVGSVNLLSGDKTPDPGEGFLHGIGRDSVVLVCAIPHRRDTLPAGPTCKTAAGVAFTLYPERVDMRVFELHTGREIGAGTVVAEAPPCPPQPAASSVVSASDYELAAWVADHLRGGYYH